MQTKIDQDFRQQLDGWVEAALYSGMTRFDELIGGLPGVCPQDALQALGRLTASGRTTAILANQLAMNASAVHRGTDSLWIDDSLPRPHPLDYSWLFDDDTVERLLAEVLEYTRAGSSIALLGVPKVFQAMARMQVARRVALLDADAAAVRALDRYYSPRFQAIHSDLTTDVVPVEAGEIVVADAPWYEGEMRSFLWLASSLCKPGGMVLFSLPGLGTRPGISCERDRLIQWGAELGLQLLCLKQQAVGYLSPLFERRALAAAGVPVVAANWRRGDMAVFMKHRESLVARPFIAPKESWEEETVGGARIRIRSANEKSWGDPRLQPIVNGDILPSVSRRDPRRSQVDVWTSNNRVFACQGPYVLHLILVALRRGDSVLQIVSDELGRPLTSSDKRAVELTAGKVLDVVNLEQAEWDEYCDTSKEHPVGLVAHR